MRFYKCSPSGRVPTADIIYMSTNVFVYTEITWYLSCQHKLRGNNEMLTELFMLVVWIILLMGNKLKGSWHYVVDNLGQE